MTPTFEQIVKDHLAWTTATFPKGTAIGALMHANKEIDEVIADIVHDAPKEQTAIEYADILGCVIDSFNRRGISLEMVLQAYHDKLQINKARAWKDNGDGSYSHVKNMQPMYTVEEIGAKLDLWFYENVNLSQSEFLGFTGQEFNEYMNNGTIPLRDIK